MKTDPEDKHLDRANLKMEKYAIEHADEAHNTRWLGVRIRKLSHEALVGIIIHLAAEVRKRYEHVQ